MTTLPISVTIFLVSLLPFVFSQPAPFLCPRGTISNNITCIPCPPGTYQDNSQVTNTLQNATTCISCDGGSISTITGLTTSILCRPCPSNSISSPNNTVCIPCPPSTLSNATACLSCPPGSFIPLFPFQSPESCELCFFNTYTSIANTRGRCKPCPPGFATQATGATSLSDCIPCPDGQDTSNGFGCSPCSEDQYFNSITRTCRQCEPGTTPRAGGGCEPCPVNTFTNLQLLDGPAPNRSCQVCPDGFETAAPGATFCRRIGGPCPSNFITAPNGNCVRCLVDYQYDSASGSCRPCPPGTGSDGGVETACKPCTDLYLESLRNPAVIEDLPTRFFDRRSSCRTGSDILIPLFEQQRRSSAGLISIRDEGGCPPGTQKFEVDGLPPLCEECLSGTFSTDINVEKCQKCPEGSTSDSGSTGCNKCPNGTIPFGTECVTIETECPPGELKSFIGECRKTCSNGKLPPLLDQPDECTNTIFTVPGCDGCKICPDGRTGQPFNPGNCVCAGTFAKNRGVDETGKCVQCPPGFYGKQQLTKNEPADNICAPCPAGTFAEKLPENELVLFRTATKGPGPRSVCQFCPIDSFTDKEGMAECMKCPPGSFTYGIGETKCLNFNN